MRSWVLGVVAATAAIWLVGYAPPATAGPTGAMASTVGPGGFSVAATLGYLERDVQDGGDDEISSRRMSFRAQFGLMDRLDVYAILGFGDLKFDDASFTGTLGENLGLGVHYAMLDFEESDTRLMFDAQAEYLRSTDDEVRVLHHGYHVAIYLLKEIGAAGRMGYFYPYGGVRVSYAIYDGNHGMDTYAGDDFIGVFGGADYFVNPNVYFSGEVHVFDETSLYLGVGYRF